MWHIRSTAGRCCHAQLQIPGGLRKIYDGISDQGSGFARVQGSAEQDPGEQGHCPDPTPLNPQLSTPNLYSPHNPQPSKSSTLNSTTLNPQPSQPSQPSTLTTLNPHNPLNPLNPQPSQPSALPTLPTLNPNPGGRTSSCLVSQRSKCLQV